MKTVSVNASKNYDIIIGRDVINMLPEKIEKLFNKVKVMIVTDDKVASFHLEKLRKLLDENNIENDVFIFPNGEKSKSPETLFLLLEAVFLVVFFSKIMFLPLPSQRLSLYM